MPTYACLYRRSHVGPEVSRLFLMLLNASSLALIIETLPYANPCYIVSSSPQWGHPAMSPCNFSNMVPTDHSLCINLIVGRSRSIFYSFRAVLCAD
jgi:hypothetical protein